MRNKNISAALFIVIGSVMLGNAVSSATKQVISQKMATGLNQNQNQIQTQTQNQTQPGPFNIIAGSLQGDD
jgi:hypothetical protein